MNAWFKKPKMESEIEFITWLIVSDVEIAVSGMLVLESAKEKIYIRRLASDEDRRPWLTLCVSHKLIDAIDYDAAFDYGIEGYVYRVIRRFPNETFVFMRTLGKNDTPRTSLREPHSINISGHFLVEKGWALFNQ